MIGQRGNKTRATLILLALIMLIGAFFAAAPSAEAKNIVKGDTTANVRLVQQRLSNLGYYTYKVDGIWGWRTTAAVKKFQKAKGLVADGIVGAKTEKALGITLSGGKKSGTLSSTELNLLRGRSTAKRAASRTRDRSPLPR